MDGDADAARELERLRAELTEFVVDALGERMAIGEQPELSARLVEAIDRRVDQAVANRMADAEWPDPERFAEAVLAAAAGKSVDAESLRSTRGAGAPAPRRRGVTPLQLGLLLLGAIILTAALTYFILRSLGDGTTTTNVAAPAGPDPVIYDTNGQQLPGDNLQLPPPNSTATAPENAQGPTP